MSEPTFLIAFGVGFLSFLAPCTLPVLPGYYSYLAGISQEKNGSQKQLKVFITSLAFVGGFMLVLLILGASASALGRFFLINRLLWQKVGGLLIIIFGLQMMGVLKWGLLGKSTNFNFGRYVPWKRGKAFLAGASFGLGWTPCIGPILGSILILASQTQTLTRGAGLLLAFALGLAIPMLFSGFFISQLKYLRSQYVSVISGVILITLGILLFFGQYFRLTVWMSQIYRTLNIPIY